MTEITKKNYVFALRPIQEEIKGQKWVSVCWFVVRFNVVIGIIGGDGAIGSPVAQSGQVTSLGKTYQSEQSYQERYEDQGIVWKRNGEEKR